MAERGPAAGGQHAADRSAGRGSQKYPVVDDIQRKQQLSRGADGPAIATVGAVDRNARNVRQNPRHNKALSRPGRRLIGTRSVTEARANFSSKVSRCVKINCIPQVCCPTFWGAVHFSQDRRFNAGRFCGGNCRLRPYRFRPAAVKGRCRSGRRRRLRSGCTDVHRA